MSEIELTQSSIAMSEDRQQSSQTTSTSMDTSQSAPQQLQQHQQQQQQQVSSTTTAGTPGGDTVANGAGTPGAGTPVPPSHQGDFLSSSMPLPKPPENPANTVPSKTLWMGDIEPWWDEDYIVQIWQKMNKRVFVKVIKPKQGLLMHQIANSNGQSNFSHSGYCFIEFDTPDDAHEALTLNGSMIPSTNNKLFRLNWASAATLNSQIAQTPEYSLFVGDLSPGTTEAHLLALFQTNFNTVKTVRVMTDPATGLSRCFGFVRFSTEDDRKRALVEMNGKWLGGRPIRVALATPKHQNMYNKNNNQNGGNNGGPIGGGMPGMPMDPMDQQGAAMYMTAPGQMPPPIGYFAGPPQAYGPNGSPTNPPVGAAAAVTQAFNDPNNTTVFVGGLSSVVTEDTLMTLFEQFGQIIHVKVPPGKESDYLGVVQTTVTNNNNK
ncbi:unnamed protein product [Ambrosiozyma monospora]|uniref:Unnamed protein product n=1 Tax=Ambrosiozyma monospora TaxID=43982 RepID=A0A9W6YWV1_AMBMO|nr:unnamed protein product [Ambrosiozyma monospora]